MIDGFFVAKIVFYCYYSRRIKLTSLQSASHNVSPYVAKYLRRDFCKNILHECLVADSVSEGDALQPFVVFEKSVIRVRPLLT